MDSMASANTPSPPDPDWPELRQERRAIVVVDVVESVRLMQANEADFINRWRRFVNEVRTQVLPVHGGRLVKSLGDGLLLEFETVPAAVTVAREIHRRIGAQNAARDAAAAIWLRIGAHVGDIVADDLDVYGSGVNLAARLATLAGPGQSVVSASVCNELVDGVDSHIEDLGDCYLKHLADPVRAFRLEDVALPRTTGSEMLDLRPSVAVLPLFGRFAGPDHGVIGDVFADEVCISLSRCIELQVISRLSTAALKNRPDAADALKALNVHYVVAGSYDLSGDRAHLRIELSDPRLGSVLWSDTANVSAAQLLSGDERVLEDVVASIGAAIIAREVRCATSRPMPNVESHALMSAAISLMHRSNAAQFMRARDMIEHLRERHRNLPQPHAWLAKWHVLRVVQGWSDDPLRDGERAIDAGHRALDGDARSSLALTMQGLAQSYLLHDFELARRSYDSALQINPNESMAMLLLGTMHAFLGDGVPAWELTQHALRLSPFDPLRYFYLSLSASAAISAQRYDDAIDLAKRSLKANRTHLSTYRALAIAQSLSGDIDAAGKTLEELLTLEPGFTVTRFLERYPGRDRVPEYARFLADALERAGLPV